MPSSVKDTILRFVKTRKFKVFLGFYVFYKLIFNVFTADFAVPLLFSKASTGSLQANFQTFSLFYGIEVKDLKILSGEDFQKAPVLTADRLALRYSLPSLLFLKLKVSSVALVQAKVYATEANGKWNFATLFPPSTETKEIEEEKEESEASDKISLYLPFKFEAHVLLDDISFFLSKSNGDFAKIEHFFFSTDIVTNRFNSIPFSPLFLQEVDLLKIQLNPDSKFQAHIQNENLAFKDSIPSRIQILWDLQKTDPELVTDIQFGSEDWKVVFGKKEYRPSLLLKLKTEFDPVKDVFQCQSFLLRVLKDDWIRMEGEVIGAQKPDRAIDFQIKESKISLTNLQSELGPLLTGFGVPALAGEVSLLGTSVKGNMTDLKSQITLAGKGIKVNLPNKTWSIPNLSLDLEALLNLNETAEPTAANPIPNLTQLNLRELKTNPNGIQVEGTAVFGKKTGLDALFRIENLVLGEFTGAVSGKTKLTLNVLGQNFENLFVKLNLLIDGFRYSIERSRSPNSQLNLIAETNLLFNKPFGLSKVMIQKLELLQKDSDSKPALDLKMAGNVDLGENLIVNVANLTIKPTFVPLNRTLPLVIREKTKDLPSLLGEQLTLKLNLNASIGKTEKSITGGFGAQIPGLEINDLNAQFDVLIKAGNAESISIRKFDLFAFEKVLQIKAQGILDKRIGKDKPPLGPFFGDLKVSLKLQSAKLQYLLKGASFQGLFELALNIKDYDIFGNLTSKDSTISTKSGDCPGDSCKLMLVDKIQADIPIHHQLIWNKEKSLITADKTPYIKNKGRSLPPNFKIMEVVGTHPNIANLPFEFLKKQKDSPAFSARIEYKENFASIDALRAYTLDGIILGEDMLFNLGSGNPETMEFRGNVQIRDIDLKQLMAPKIRDKIDDGKLKADLNIEVRDFRDPVANLDLFFSIFQIGSDFGKSALNVISPQNFLMDRITDSYSVNKIEVSLSKGLVYADVFFRRSLLSLIVNLEDNKISQQRMPLASFLKRAQSEIENYQ